VLAGEPVGGKAHFPGERMLKTKLTSGTISRRDYVSREVVGASGNAGPGFECLAYLRVNVVTGVVGTIRTGMTRVSPTTNAIPLSLP